MNDAQQPAFVNAATMSEISGIPEPALKRMAFNGGLPAVQVGKSLMFDREGTINTLRAMATEQAAAKAKDNA